MSISGGLDRAVERGASVQCEAIQIFSKNSNQWKAKPLHPGEVEAFKARRKSWGSGPVLVHDSYLINLASPKPADREKSEIAFYEEMERCEQLDIPYLVFHPGAHLGSGEEEGCRMAAESLNRTMKRAAGFKVRLLIETTAGQGTSIGYRFEHMRMILDVLRWPERAGVCLDTCHVFAAGYDIRTREGYESAFEAFDRKVGLSAIRAFHVNDSKKDFLSRVDRHEHIGKGFIGLEAFRLLMNDHRFTEVPMVLETPKGEDLKEDRENLALLRSLIKKQN